MSRLLITCVILLFSVAAAEAETLKLSLRDAMNMALENNSQIKAARFKSQAAGQGVESANSRYLPAVSFEETLLASNAPTNLFMMKLGGVLSPRSSRYGPVGDKRTRLDYSPPLNILRVY
jgi:outer membrane protein